jgi:tetratricopeptide (TPR) repeat protein
MASSSGRALVSLCATANVRLLAGLALIAALLLSASSRADAPEPSEDRRARARAMFEEGERATAELRFAEALAAYEKVMTIDPGAPFAKLARIRAADLTAHREGGFAPLARLEAVRRRPDADRATIDALARDVATFPAGRVRGEARLVVAEAYWHRFGEIDLAASALGEVLADGAADRLTRALAMNELVALERQRGDLEAAHRAVESVPDLVPALRAEISRLMRRVLLRRIAIGMVAVLGAIGLASIARLLLRTRDPERVMRSVVRPLAVGFALYLGGAAAILVRLHGDGDARPFIWLGLGVFGVDVVARAWRLGSGDTRALARTGRAVACAAGVLAVAFLSLEGANAGYLENFGL